MGLLGIGKGVAKIVMGAVSGDAEEIIRGVKKIAINTVTTIAVNEAEERLTSDDDDDD
jgi:uncharacterized protein YjaG (DUF416 family)